MGNAFSALLAWLDVRSVGGKIVLRIEDLDPERCSSEKAERLAADLRWLGLDWDEGGVMPEYMQSARGEHYQAAFDRLAAAGLVYPCFCSRAERLAASAPHATDGTPIYSGRCRDLCEDERLGYIREGRRPAWRLRVPNEDVSLMDGNLGGCTRNLLRDCGDFIIKRSDGVFAYQLAVVVDDAAMGVTRVVRGSDLLSSTPQQIWLHRLLGYEPPRFYHVPLLLAADGRRLAKRDGSLAISELRKRHTPEEIIGRLAWWAGLLNEPIAVAAADLVDGFSWDRVAKSDVRVDCRCLV